MGTVEKVISNRAWVNEKILRPRRPFLLDDLVHLGWDLFAIASMVCLLIEAALPEDRLMPSSSAGGVNLILNARIVYRAGGHIQWTLVQAECHGLFRCSDLRDNPIAFMTL